MYGFSHTVMPGIWREKKTYLITVAMGFGAAVNGGLNLWLVPLYGGMGAAVATSLAFLAMSLVTLFMNQRLWRIPYPMVVFALQIAIGVVACALLLKVFSCKTS